MIILQVYLYGIVVVGVCLTLMEFLFGSMTKFRLIVLKQYSDEELRSPDIWVPGNFAIHVIISVLWPWMIIKFFSGLFSRGA